MSVELILEAAKKPKTVIELYRELEADPRWRGLSGQIGPRVSELHRFGYVERQGEGFLTTPKGLLALDMLRTMP